MSSNLRGLQENCERGSGAHNIFLSWETRISASIWGAILLLKCSVTWRRVPFPFQYRYKSNLLVCLEPSQVSTCMGWALLASCVPKFLSYQPTVSQKQGCGQAPTCLCPLKLTYHLDQNSSSLNSRMEGMNFKVGFRVFFPEETLGFNSRMQLHLRVKNYFCILFLKAVLSVIIISTADYFKLLCFDIPNSQIIRFQSFQASAGNIFFSAH